MVTNSGGSIIHSKGLHLQLWISHLKGEFSLRISTVDVQATLAREPMHVSITPQPGMQAFRLFDLLKPVRLLDQINSRHSFSKIMQFFFYEVSMRSRVDFFMETNSVSALVYK